MPAHDPAAWQKELEKAKKQMKTVIADQFDKLDGACDYFQLLEDENMKQEEKVFGAR